MILKKSLQTSYSNSLYVLKSKSWNGSSSPIVNKVGRRIHPKQNDVQNSILLLLFHRFLYTHRQFFKWLLLILELFLYSYVFTKFFFNVSDDSWFFFMLLELSSFWLNSGGKMWLLCCCVFTKYFVRVIILVIFPNDWRSPSIFEL